MRGAPLETAACKMKGALSGTRHRATKRPRKKKRKKRRKKQKFVGWHLESKRYEKHVTKEVGVVKLDGNALFLSNQRPDTVLVPS